MTSQPCLLGVDIGTQTLKAILVQEDGRVLATASAPAEVLHPQPGWMEHDPEKSWWDGFVGAVREVLSAGGVPPGSLAALCISGLFPAMCALDDAGRPVRPAILYGDTRAAGDVALVQALTGAELKGDEVVPRLLWMKRHEPAAYRRTRVVLGPPGYIVYRLTREYSVDPQTAFRLGGLINRQRDGWQTEMCAGLEIDPALLPPVVPTTSIVGRVTREASSVTGLAAGTPVLAGTTDTFATLLGNGVTRRGEGMIYYGTTGLLTVCSRDLEEVLAHPVVIDSRTPFILAAYLLDFGETLEWLIRHLEGRSCPDCAEESDAYAALEQRAAGLPAGSMGLVAMPHFAGRLVPRQEPFMRGAFLGLNIAHSSHHIWRAMLEAFGYEIALSARALGDEGIAIGRVVAAGGGARSRLWRQIVSDVTGLRQEHIEGGGAALGAAFLAGYGVGLFGSLGEISQRWLQVTDKTAPNEGATRQYEPFFRIYRLLDAALLPCYTALAEALEALPAGEPQGKEEPVVIDQTAGE